jgi:hypothetical protein
MAMSFFSLSAMPMTSVFIFDIEASVHSIMLSDIMASMLSDIMASSAENAGEIKVSERTAAAR